MQLNVKHRRGLPMNDEGEEFNSFSRIVAAGIEPVKKL
jgi:hypothetical protein